MEIGHKFRRVHSANGKRKIDRKINNSLFSALRGVASGALNLSLSNKMLCNYDEFWRGGRRAGEKRLQLMYVCWISLIDLMKVITERRMNFNRVREVNLTGRNAARRGEPARKVKSVKLLVVTFDRRCTVVCRSGCQCV